MKFNVLAAFVALGAAVSGAHAQTVLRGQAGPIIILAPPQPAQQPAASNPPVSQAAVLRGGILILNLTINISSAIPVSTPIKCSFGASMFGLDPVTGPEYYLESSDALATRNGATATCSLRIPYAWTINNIDNARYTWSYFVEALDANGFGRTSSIPQFLGTGSGLPIPANGANTVFSRTVRL